MEMTLEEKAQLFTGLLKQGELNNRLTEHIVELKNTVKSVVKTNTILVERVLQLEERIAELERKYG